LSGHADVTLVEQCAALARGEHSDPFAVLGPHAARKSWAVRCFHPQAERVELFTPDGELLGAARPLAAHGLFELRMPLPVRPYRLRVFENGRPRDMDDPYRFGAVLGDLDRHLIGEGRHERLYELLGARPVEFDGVAGVQFAVWAPAARRVSVVGPFNQWDGRRHPMRLHPANGVWDLFLPGLRAGELYKFELLGPDGRLLPLKSDPLARRMEPPPGNASIVHESVYQWQDAAWMDRRAEAAALDRPVAIYEVHPGSWRHRLDVNRPDSGSALLAGRLSYRELASELVEYVRDMGFTHIELLPINEHPFDGSWGYQPIGMFAPTWRYGSPDDFKYFVDACHAAGLGVIVDWVPAHFPRDAHGLACFDGTSLYEYADPRLGEHKDWGTLVFDFARPEVVNYLIANAQWWIGEYHIDALRVDAVASMLYLDYSREAGEWLPNRYGGNENLEAIVFMRRLNEVIHAMGAMTMAEESTAWPMVSRPTYVGGLGYSYKWNMGWMHDTLAYLREDPVHRQYHQDGLTFGLLYAFSENFVLPLSHDEVVHGKGSLLGKMPGDAWQRFANLRLLYAFMYAYPGKKLLFMGGEFAQEREWSVDRALDWGLLEQSAHRGIQTLVRDLNGVYTARAAAHERDCDASGFSWVDCSDHENSVIAFLRLAHDVHDHVLVVCNFTPVVRYDYRIGVPSGGRYLELLNTDAEPYGGSGAGNLGVMSAEAVAAHGHASSLRLTLPPLAALFLVPEIEDINE
jgi:1,4-alpha-glucan branching enzyme